MRLDIDFALPKRMIRLYTGRPVKLEFWVNVEKIFLEWLMKHLRNIYIFKKEFIVLKLLGSSLLLFAKSVNLFYFWSFKSETVFKLVYIRTVLRTSHAGFHRSGMGLEIFVLYKVHKRCQWFWTGDHTLSSKFLVSIS